MADQQLTITVIRRLAESVQQLGRVKLMKLLFFLQEVEGQQLGYRFSLYDHGPFDKAVLRDLDRAEMLDHVHSEYWSSATAWGYTITPTEPGEPLDDEDQLTSLSPMLKQAIDRVAERYGQRSARDLELASTIVLVGRQTSGGTDHRTRTADVVESVKPHFSLAEIEAEYDRLAESGVSLTT